MKTILLAASMCAFAATASAQNFNSSLVLEHKSLDFVVQGDTNGVSLVEAGITVLPHNLGAIKGDLRLSVGAFGDFSDTFIKSEHNLSLYATNATTIYAVNALQYEPGGIWTFEPSIGLEVALTNSLAAFAEISHAWVYTSSVAAAGGQFSVGANLKLDDYVTIRPSVSRSFNVANEDTSVALEFVLRF